MYPITPEGRFAAGALMLLGITLFAAITGTMTSVLVASHAREPSSASIPDQIRDLARLREEGHISAEEFAAKKEDLLARM